MSTSVTPSPTISPVTMLSYMDGVVGGAFSSATNQFFFVEFDGEIHQTTVDTKQDQINVVPWSDQVVQSGPNGLEDIALSRDGQYAYVIQRGDQFVRQGRLLQVALHPKPGPAVIVEIAREMAAPRQIALDENRHQAYVVESGAPGRLLRINLKDGSLNTVVSGLQSAGGVAVTSAGDFAYVAEHSGPRAGKITCIDLTTYNLIPVASGLSQPFFLSFLDDTESRLLVTERDPQNLVRLVDIATGLVTDLAHVPAVQPGQVDIVDKYELRGPQKAVAIAPDKVLVCSDWGLSLLNLSPYSATTDTDVLLGLGWVPVDCISDGYADTTQHSKVAAVFPVEAAPFGGSIAVMFNHRKAGLPPINAAFYMIEVDGVPQADAFTDIQRSPKNNYEPQLVATQPTTNKLFQVRPADQIGFYEHEGLVGGVIDTTKLKDGQLHTIAIRLFTEDDLTLDVAGRIKSEIGNSTDAGRQVQILVDNTAPVASIDQIHVNGTPVEACGFAYIGKLMLTQGQTPDNPPDTAGDKFQFIITAKQPGKHFQGWSLSVVWGANRGGELASWNWTPPALPHAPNWREWLGLAPGTVPTSGYLKAWVANDPSSINCAHTFTLSVSDRVINGWQYIHSAQYTKSITVLALDKPPARPPQ